MEEKDIKTVKTTRGELRYYRDWGNYDGGIVMLNAQTIDRYKAIKNEHPDADKCGVFFAFSREQFAEGYNHLVELGHIKDGDKICQDKVRELSVQRTDLRRSSNSTTIAERPSRKNVIRRRFISTNTITTSA